MIKFWKNSNEWNVCKVGVAHFYCMYDDLWYNKLLIKTTEIVQNSVGKNEVSNKLDIDLTWLWTNYNENILCNIISY